jgi:hypothetical protein
MLNEGTVTRLDFGHVQQREDHWAIADLRGKARHTRTVPMPGWVKDLLDGWLRAANLTAGRLFRRVNKRGKAWGEGLTERQSGMWFANTPARRVLRGSLLTI